MKRTFDATFLNSVANEPSVREQIGGPDGPIDYSVPVFNADNFAFEFEGGGYVVVKHETGIYEAHTQFLPNGRGALAINAAAEAFRYMFTSTDCLEVVTRVPVTNTSAALYARAVGFVEKFRRKAAWPVNGEMVDMVYYGLTIERWALRDTNCLAKGRDFHDKLELAKEAMASGLPSHDDDDTHDAIVGASWLMINAGNPQKAIWFYNRWARLAGYDPVNIVSLNPVVIDIMDAVIESRNGDMEVLLCREQQ